MVADLKSKSDLEEKSERNSMIAPENFDLNYDRTEENEIQIDEEPLIKSSDLKPKGMKAKFGTQLFNIVKSKIKGIGKIIVAGQSDNKEKYLSIPKTDEDNNYNSQSLAQLWSIFKYLFHKSEKVLKVNHLFKFLYIFYLIPYKF